MQLTILHRDNTIAWWEVNEKILLYFDIALAKVLEKKVIEAFVSSSLGLKPSMYRLEILKYIGEDWENLFHTKNREFLKRETFVYLQHLGTYKMLIFK